MKIFYLLIFLPLMVCSQEYKGVKFEKEISWDQVKAKAGIAKKYIFVDCFATWCGPCKRMDKNVYTDENVGNFINDKFICIKVQIDTLKSDNDQIRQWYSDAHEIMRCYAVTAFPTYLFFSPDGNIVHRALGYRGQKDFIELAKEALDTSKQYYTLLRNYQKGNRDTSTMRQLALNSKISGDVNVAFQIANEYAETLKYKKQYSKDDLNFMKEFEQSLVVQKIITDYKITYLDKLDNSSLCTKENYDFIIQFPKLSKSTDGFFKLCYYHPDKVDLVLSKKGFSDRYVRRIIKSEEINDKIYHNGTPIPKEPSWNNIKYAIRRKYNNVYATTLVQEAKLEYYKRIGNWSIFATLRDKQIQENPPTAGKALFDANGSWMLNVDAWNVFLYCSDTVVLRKALNWIDLAISLEKPSPNDQLLDTRANILYKMGKVSEAILQEQEAIEIGTANAKRDGRDGVTFDGYVETINKMKNGIPSWTK